MRTAEIFNGNALIKVNEGSKFKLNGVWTWDIGTQVTFTVKRGINVVTSVISKDGSGSEFEVLSINTIDDLAEISVEAEDVDFEDMDNKEEVEEHIEDEVVENITEDKDIAENVYSKLELKKNKFTKKEIVAYIKDNNIDLDISKTKAELVRELELRDLVEYK